MYPLRVSNGNQLYLIFLRVIVLFPKPLNTQPLPPMYLHTLLPDSTHPFSMKNMFSFTLILMFWKRCWNLESGQDPTILHRVKTDHTTEPIHEEFFIKVSRTTPTPTPKKSKRNNLGNAIHSLKRGIIAVQHLFLGMHPKATVSPQKHP